MRLDQVPEDVLILIFTNICFHCQNKDHFVNADVTEVVRDKKALAYLCRMSKALCNVAQPILYHYYATGNLEKGRKRWTAAERIHGPPWEYDFLPQFLRTIVLRPDLAVRVKTLQIIPHRARWYGKTPESKYEGHVDVMEFLLNSATERNLLPWRSKMRNYTAETPLDHDELLLVGLQCMSQVHTLLLARSHPAEFGGLQDDSDLILPPLITFPSLKTVGLIRASNDYDITDLAEFFCAAPNIETLYACDSGGWSKNDSGFASREGRFCINCVIFGLLRLRKLVIDGLSTISASDLIWSINWGLEEAKEEFHEKFPGLEDLEYYWDDMTACAFSFDNFLWPVTNTLKRLCLAYLPRSMHALHDWEAERDLSDSEDEWRDVYGVPMLDYDPISSLATFKVLADISIDCRSIYRANDPDTSDRLVSFLPPTVARLRITYTFRNMENGLYQLASQAPKDFPSLKEVVIGVPSGISAWTAEGVGRMKGAGLEDVFERAGVKFVWAVDKLGADSRTMIPGATAGSVLVPVPGLGEKKMIE